MKAYSKTLHKGVVTKQELKRIVRKILREDFKLRHPIDV